MTQKYKGNGGGKLTSDTSPAPTRRPQRTHPKPETLHQLLGYGEELSRLMDSPVLNLAWSWTIEGLTEQLIGSGPEEKAKREDLHRQIQLMGALKNTMSHYIEMAKLEHQKLLQQQQMEQQAMQAGVPAHEL